MLRHIIRTRPTPTKAALVLAALAAAIIPIVAARLGLRLAHLINLFIGGLALYLIHRFGSDLLLWGIVVVVTHLALRPLGQLAVAVELVTVRQGSVAGS